jgi:hypothetical protein
MTKKITAKVVLGELSAAGIGKMKDMVEWRTSPNRRADPLTASRA